jgi:hypothetical protein
MEEPKDKRTKEYKEWLKSQENNSLGLGDAIEEITKATGIKKLVGDCEGCEKRKEKANIIGHQLEYFFKKYNPNQFTNKEAKEWNLFLNRDNKNIIEPEHQELIVRLLKSILNMSVRPCPSCSASLWNKYIKMIDYVYKEYGT